MKKYLSGAAPKGLTIWWVRVGPRGKLRIDVTQKNRKHTLSAKKVFTAFSFFNGELTGEKIFEKFDKSPVPRMFDGELAGKKFSPLTR